MREAVPLNRPNPLPRYDLLKRRAAAFGIIQKMRAVLLKNGFNDSCIYTAVKEVRAAQDDITLITDTQEQDTIINEHWC